MLGFSIALDFFRGCSATGILHLLNQTLHLLNQTPGAQFMPGQVEMATYGSEFMAACQAMEQINDIYYTLHMLGVPLDGPTWLLGNNQAVINSTTIPHSSLSKFWNALSYHHCREAVAADIVHFKFLPHCENPSDILTKTPPMGQSPHICQTLPFLERGNYVF